MVFEVEGAAPAARTGSETGSRTGPAAKPAEKPAPQRQKAEAKADFAENDAYVHATPVIRRLAREFGVNLAKVKGTGRKGRILQRGRAGLRERRGETR